MFAIMFVVMLFLLLLSYIAEKLGLRKEIMSLVLNIFGDWSFI